MGQWQQRYLVEPVRSALRTVPVGGQIPDGEIVRSLAIGVEGLFRNEVAARYPGWPPESTTDGSSIHLCWRSAGRQVTAVGLSALDFGGDRFPFRAELTAEGDDRGGSACCCRSGRSTGRWRRSG